MKLYATVTSERASKGQGGNEFVRIELTTNDFGSLRKLDEFTLADDEVLGLILYDKNGNVLKKYGPRTEKGEKQKGEVCDYCGTKEGSKKHCDPNNPKLLHSWETTHN